MSADNTDMGKWAIGSGCPKGAMYIGRDGEPKFTPYGLGYLAAELATDEGLSLEEAIPYVAERAGRPFASCLS